MRHDVNGPQDRSCPEYPEDARDTVREMLDRLFCWLGLHDWEREFGPWGSPAWDQCRLCKAKRR